MTAVANGNTDVLGSGIDLVETARMEEVLRRWGERFKRRVFLPSERAYCDRRACPSRHYAARFAVKEAVTKAFGTGIGSALGWRDVEVIRDGGRGAPAVRLSRRAAALAQGRGVQQILISLSHTRHYAVAQAILLGRPSPEKSSCTP